MRLEELGTTLDGGQAVLCLSEVGGEAGVEHPAEGLGLLLVLNAKGLTVLAPRGQNLTGHFGWGDVYFEGKWTSFFFRVHFLL